MSQLCRDLQQSDYRKISNEHLARRMQEIKEGPEAEEMCREEEEFGKRRYEKGVEDQVRMDTIKFLKMNWSVTKIAEFVERSIEEVESYASASGMPYKMS